MAALTAALIGAGVSAAASGIGAGIAARKRKKAEKEEKKILGQMESDNEANFLRDYYRDAFDDPTTKSYLKRISGEMYDKSKAIDSSGIATGATHESIQARKQSANEVMSDAVNNVVVNQEQRKQAAKDNYIRRKDAIASGNMEMARSSGEMQAQNWSNLGNNLADSATGLASAYVQGGGKLFGGRKSTAAPGLSAPANRALSVPEYSFQKYMQQKLTNY